MPDAEHTSGPIIIKNGNGWVRHIGTGIAALVAGAALATTIFARSERVAVVEAAITAIKTEVADNEKDNEANWTQQHNLNGRFDRNDKAAIHTWHRIELRLHGLEVRFLPKERRQPAPPPLDETP